MTATQAKAVYAHLERRYKPSYAGLHVPTVATIGGRNFSADEVVVVERQEGETKLTRLSSDDLLNWLEDYSLSELYDKGVIGGRP